MHVSIKPEILFHIGSFPITNTMLTSWLVIIVISLFAVYISKNLKKEKPNKAVLLLEIIFEKLIDFLGVFAGSKEKVKKFFPLVATIFFYVLISNWMGTLPGVETIGLVEHAESGYQKTEVVTTNTHTETDSHKEEDSHASSEKFLPLLRTVFSDLNMTLVLAFITVISTHVIGFSSIGAKHHIGKFLVNPLKNPIGTFVGLLELIGEVSRVVSLTFRLFGNIFAGSVLMLIISHLAGFIVPIPFLGLELFVGFIQALVFAVLTMLFIASATEMHHEEEHHEAKGH